MSLVESIGIGALLASFIMYLISNDVRNFFHDLEDVVTRASPEVLLMMVCGFLLVELSNTNISIIESLSIIINQNIKIALFFILVILPIMSIFGIHPLILFSSVYPIIDSTLFPSDIIKYYSWVGLFVGSQLLSPVSISAISAANALGISSLETSVKLHFIYTMSLAMLLWVYIIFFLL